MDIYNLGFIFCALSVLFAGYALFSFEKASGNKTYKVTMIYIGLLVISCVAPYHMDGGADGLGGFLFFMVIGLLFTILSLVINIFYLMEKFSRRK